jgi:hypothetical protein
MSDDKNKSSAGWNNELGGLKQRKVGQIESNFFNLESESDDKDEEEQQERLEKERQEKIRKW